MEKKPHDMNRYGPVRGFVVCVLVAAIVTGKPAAIDTVDVVTCAIYHSLPQSWSFWDLGARLQGQAGNVLEQGDARRSA
jgi:hypothetical protein